MRSYYHNITQGWYNEQGYMDAVEKSNNGDIIKMSFSGNAMMIDLIKEDMEIESKGEYDFARKEFFDYFKDFHEEEFVSC